MSICATHDDGFTIAGRTWGSAENGGNNGFIGHFKPIPNTAINISHQLPIGKNVHNVVGNGSKAIFTVENTAESSYEITICNAAGQIVVRFSNVKCSLDKKSIVWDCSRLGRGVYFYRVKSDVLRSNGTLILN